MDQHNEQWFKERIGKTVYQFMKEPTPEEITILDDTHANYLCYSLQDEGAYYQDIPVQVVKTIDFNNVILSDKSQRAMFADKVIRDVLDGNLNPLQLRYNLKLYEEIIDTITDDTQVKKLILEEAEKQASGKKSFQYNNSSIEIKEAGAKYDWEKCGDPIVLKLQKDLKERQDLLKGLPPSGLEIQCGDEIIKCYPPAKSSTTSITIKLK